MNQIHQCQILENIHLSERYCQLIIAAPEIAQFAQAGQFVNLSVGQQISDDPLLNRPFSIYQVDQKAGVIELLFKVVGRGTEFLAKRSSGTIEIIGPLGRGFSVPTTGSALLVAGGIGLAPLKELANQLLKTGLELKLLLGLTEEQDLILASLVKELDPEIIIVKPDKTSYPQGLITDLVKEVLRKNDYDHFYACGPKPMLYALQKLLGQRAKDAQFSLEEQMGCGVGLCFSCVTKVVENKTDWRYERICTCGPVFDGDEVIFL